MLRLPAQLGDWYEREADPRFQDRIRGISLFRDGEAYALAAPRAFRRVRYTIETDVGLDMGEPEKTSLRSIRVAAQCDAVCSTMTLYLAGDKMVRFDTRFTGKQRFRP